MASPENEPCLADILIVEDTPDNLKLLAQILGMRGYHVRPVASGSAALAEAQATPPDLVLLDILLPEMDGYQVCRELKADARTCDIPVIFISALGSVKDKMQAFRAGGVDYVSKPFQANEVLARVEVHLALRALQRQLQAQNAQLQLEIVERRRVEEALCTSQANLVALIENSNGSIWSIDTRYRLIVGNSGYRKQVKAATGREIAEGDIVLPDDLAPGVAEEWRGYYARALRNESFAMETALPGTSPPRCMEYRFSPICTADGAVTGVAVVGNDLTERQRAQEIEIIAEERRRIAQETHDGLVQSLAGLRFRVRHWHRLVDSNPAEMHRELDNLRTILDDSIRDMRRSIFALRPMALDEQGFFPALHKLAQEMGAHYGLQVNVQVAGEPERIPPSLELTLFRIAQEALYNVSKHAQARNAWVKLDLDHPQELRVSIRDDGQGFDLQELPQRARQGHLGLVQMRERVTKVGGALEIASRPGQGTHVQVILPAPAPL